MAEQPSKAVDSRRKPTNMRKVACACSETLVSRRRKPSKADETDQRMEHILRVQRNVGVQIRRSCHRGWPDFPPFIRAGGGVGDPFQLGQVVWCRRRGTQGRYGGLWPTRLLLRGRGLLAFTLLLLLLACRPLREARRALMGLIFRVRGSAPSL